MTSSKALPYVSGILLGLAFWWPQLAFMALFGLLPYLIFLQQRPSAKAIRLHTWGMGVVLMGIVLVWIWQLHADTWLPVGKLTGTIFIGISWLITALTFSLGFLVLGLILSYFRARQIRHWQYYAILIASWLVGEYVCSWLYSLVSAGHGASLGPYWNFGSLGFLAVSLNMGVLARWVGLYGLSALVLLINYALFELLMRRRWRPAVLVLASMVGLWLISTLPYSPRQPSQVNVMAVQLNDELGGSALQNLKAKSQAMPPTDIVVLPEYSDFINESDQHKNQKLQADILRNWFAGGKGFVITSRKQSDRSKVKNNQLVVYDNQMRVVSAQDKQFLIPGGEFVPFLYQPLISRFRSDSLQFHLRERTVAKAKYSEQPILLGNIKSGSLACSGIISPELYRRLARQNVSLLTNSASLNVFQTATLYHRQSEAYIRFDAVANAKPFIQATKNGDSYIVDFNGHVVRQTKRQALNPDVEIISARVMLNPGRTLYTVIGEWVLYSAIIGLLVIGAADWRRSRVQPTKARPKQR